MLRDKLVKDLDKKLLAKKKEMQKKIDGGFAERVFVNVKKSNKI